MKYLKTSLVFELSECFRRRKKGGTRSIPESMAEEGRDPKYSRVHGGRKAGPEIFPSPWRKKGGTGKIADFVIWCWLLCTLFRLSILAKLWWMPVTFDIQLDFDVIECRLFLLFFFFFIIIIMIFFFILGQLKKSALKLKSCQNSSSYTVDVND